jgi:NAD(P)H dehydrogenase (quinone)
MSPVIAVTGATGVVGGSVARRLANAGIAQRLVVRSPGRTPQLPGAEISQASYNDPAAAVAALNGIDTVFMVSGAESPDRLSDHRTFVDAAARAGVRRIVYTSFLEASATSTFLLARDHWHTEQHIRELGLEFTFLRDNLYADSLLDFAGPEGVLRGPAGNGRISAVARTDVIDAAVAVLTPAAGALDRRTAHDGVTYRLTGPEALTLSEVADTITRVTGRLVRYEPETIAESYTSRAIYGAPEWQVDAWVSTYTAIAIGELAEVTDDVQRVTGHPATSLEALLGG